MDTSMRGGTCWDGHRWPATWQHVVGREVISGSWLTPEELGCVGQVTVLRGSAGEPMWACGSWPRWEIAVPLSVRVTLGLLGEWGQLLPFGRSCRGPAGRQQPGVLLWVRGVEGGGATRRALTVPCHQCWPGCSD